MLPFLFLFWSISCCWSFANSSSDGSAAAAELACFRFGALLQYFASRAANALSARAALLPLHVTPTVNLTTSLQAYHMDNASTPIRTFR